MSFTDTKIAFLTPYFNEFPYDINSDNTATVRTAGRKLLPIEQSFIALTPDDKYPLPNKVYNIPQFSWKWRKHRGTYIDINRNYLVSGCCDDRMRQELPEDVTHYFFVDADISFTIEDVQRLINADKDIISGAYIERTHKDNYTAGFLDEHKLIDAFMPVDSHGIFEVDFVGGGFLCIKKEVFQKISFPWFGSDYLEIAHTDGTVYKKPVKEDVYFCIKAKEAGYSINIDCDCVVKHHTIQGVSVMTELERLKGKLGEISIQEKTAEQQAQKWQIARNKAAEEYKTIYEQYTIEMDKQDEAEKDVKN